MGAFLHVLSLEQKNRLFDTALGILSRVGVRVPALEVQPFLGPLNGVGRQGDILYFDQDTVEWALSAAPQSIPVFDQTGQERLSLGRHPGRETHFGMGVTNLYYQDPQDGSVVPFSRETFRRAVQLGEHLPAYDFVSTPGILGDLPPEQADLFASLEMAASTAKPLVVLISHKPSFSNAIDLIQSVQGSKRSILPYFNPQTPLLYPVDMLENLFDAVDRGLPIILSSYGMLGASTPASLTGTASLLLAELLAGLALCQRRRPGAPVILGSLPAVFDMRTTQSYYSPHSFLVNLAVHEVLNDYGIPTCGTSGCEGGWGMDIRAAGELWFNHLTAILGGIDLVPFVGSIFNSKVFSPELAVYGDTIIRQARQFSDRFEPEPEESLIDEIRAVGHGGHFLESMTTLRSFRRFLTPDIFPHIGLEEWQERGQPDMAALLNAHTREVVQALKPPEQYHEKIAAGERLIKTWSGSTHSK